MSSGNGRAAGVPDRVDYAGAVYGSLLAASVIAGTSPGRHPVPAPALAILLLATGLVFWFAHVYARLIGDRAHGAVWSRAEIRSVGAAELPLVKASVPPAAMASVGWLLGLSDATTAWLALFVALAGQVGWGVVATRRMGARTELVLVTGLVNLLLGLIIIALKVLLSH
ncbi:hypothetical protein ACWDWO_14050 [Actinopolymorpha singaporensis]|uniref:Integral membrane protein n=1 Tax=Actinopolymorpha singaporensis TaxID=117157 RepID=A0A1H1U5W9_9ACTN|nr:hypothetical protein [Actinopolymorpha singaporensis]SDS67878.1 hypothetical protein SAMN04489717_3490 [Actinopolymorpha singaporensis]